ncbi:MAG: hypothetical protein NTU61_06115 [Candidatus Altiarchaeota archaeon]|nr:hypothetical protein [Candidatus Altiarchaeota archaeon]
MIGFVFKFMWGEFVDRLMPKPRDFITALLLTTAFYLLCRWEPVAYVIFFIVSLAIVYTVSRLVYVIQAMLKLNKMRKNMGGLIDTLKGVIKR